MQIVPYLNFAGNCRAAMEFYKSVLGGEITAMMTSADAPPDSGMENWPADLVMHAQIQVGDWQLMGSDAPGEYYQKPQGLTVSLHLNDATEAERLFNELAQGGKITMPFGETFWARRFGMLTDKYDIPWMINCG